MENMPPKARVFQHNYGFAVPVVIHSWDWNATFNKWTALVTFADGWHGWSFPVEWLCTRRSRHKLAQFKATLTKAERGA
jgi:hypothetical protein